MYASKLPHTQIDRFHHIARLGVYAMLTLSVIAMTVSLNSAGTSVGSSGARAQSTPTYTCKSFKIVTSNNGAGAQHATIGADYANGKLIYYVDIESTTTTHTWGNSLNVQGLPEPLRFVSKSDDNTRATFSLDFSSYTPPENIKGTTLQFSSANMTLNSIAVGGPCTASLTIGAGPTPTPPPVTNTPTPTPTPDGGYSAKYENGAVEYRFPGTNDAGAQVILKSSEMRIGDIKSGLLRLNVQNSNKDAICGQYIWYVQTTNTRSPDISANVTCPSSGTTTTTPTLVSYSVSSDGGTVSPDGHTLTIPKSHTKNIIVKATTSNPGKMDNVLEKGKLNIYKKVDPAQADVLTKQDEHIVAPTAEGNNATFTWTFLMPAGQETDFQANFYPGTDKIHERVIIRVVNDPMTCERKTCSTGSKTYYVGTRSQAGGVQSTAYFTDASCTGTNITQQFLDGSYCGAAPFNPGDGGPVTIPNRLWLKYQITIGNGLVAGDKIVIAAKKQGTNDLKACAGRLGYSEFAMNNQFIECRQGAGTRTLIVKLVGQEEIKSWLAGSELLWGVRKATDTSNTSDPTADKSKGITVFTGRGPTGIVGNIKYTGETEQYVEIPFTIDL